MTRPGEIQVGRRAQAPSDLGPGEMDGCTRQNPDYRPADGEAPERGPLLIWHPHRDAAERLSDSCSQAPGPGRGRLEHRRRAQRRARAADRAARPGGDRLVRLRRRGDRGAGDLQRRHQPVIAAGWSTATASRGRCPGSRSARRSGSGRWSRRRSRARRWRYRSPAPSSPGSLHAPLLSSTRPLWADLVDHPDQLTSAYALQAVLLEVFFIAGPLVAAALIALGSPAAAVIAIATASCSACSRSPPPRPRAPGEAGGATVGRAGAMASAGMRALVATDVPIGAMFGALDVAVPAFAQGARRRGGGRRGARGARGRQHDRRGRLRRPRPASRRRRATRCCSRSWPC